MSQEVVPGLLGRFENRELEQVNFLSEFIVCLVTLFDLVDLHAPQEWRKAANRTYVFGDVWWFAGLLVWGFSIFNRWQNGGFAKYAWFIIHAGGSLVPLLFKWAKPATYMDHRIRLLIGIRVLRVLGVFLALGPYQDQIWAPVSGHVSCPITLLTSQYMKLAYLLCQSLAHQVPAIHHSWLMIIYTFTSVFRTIPRCRVDCQAIEYARCAQHWAGKLGFLRKIWVISIVTKDDTELEPWQSCVLIQCMLMVSI